MHAFLEIPVQPPCTITLDPPLSDEEFEHLSETCDSAFLERSKEGTLLVKAFADGLTSDGNSEVSRQFGNWWHQHRRGRVFDSSGGFFLPDGSVLNPDAAYATAEQLQGLTREQLVRFPRLAPAFVIELRSESDKLAALQEKMESWIANGTEFAWLVDPAAKQIHVYQRRAVPHIESAGRIAGSGPVDGFVLDLKEVWRCYE